MIRVFASQQQKGVAQPISVADSLYTCIHIQYMYADI